MTIQCVKFPQTFCTNLPPWISIKLFDPPLVEQMEELLLLNYNRMVKFSQLNDPLSLHKTNLGDKLDRQKL